MFVTCLKSHYVFSLYKSITYLQDKFTKMHFVLKYRYITSAMEIQCNAIKRSTLLKSRTIDMVVLLKI